MAERCKECELEEWNANWDAKFGRLKSSGNIISISSKALKTAKDKKAFEDIVRYNRAPEDPTSLVELRRKLPTKHPAYLSDA